MKSSLVKETQGAIKDSITALFVIYDKADKNFSHIIAAKQHKPFHNLWGWDKCTQIMFNKYGHRTKKSF